MKKIITTCAKGALLPIFLATLLVSTVSLSGCGKLPNQTDMPDEDSKIAIITTSEGVIKINLLEEHVPEMVKNFEVLANAGKYDGVIFHRVIEGFMIQGGDFENGNGTGGHSYKGPGTKLEDEIHPDLSHVRGAVSMANSGPNTNGSQFFIVHKDADFLDGGYSIFGQVYEGMETVDTIATTETGAMDKPLVDMIIEKIEIK